MRSSELICAAGLSILLISTANAASGCAYRDQFTNRGTCRNAPAADALIHHRDLSNPSAEDLREWERSLPSGEPEINVHNCLAALRDAQRHENIWRDQDLSLEDCKAFFLNLRNKMEDEADQIYEKVLDESIKGNRDERRRKSN